jgi:hypothetical protein
MFLIDGNSRSAAVFVILSFILLIQGSVYGKGFPNPRKKGLYYYADTAVTPPNKPFLTCMAGSGTSYVLGSNTSGLFTFSTVGRKFRPLAGARQFVGKKITALALGPSAGEIWVATFFDGLFTETARVSGRISL